MDEVVATAEIELEDGEKGLGQSGIVAVESPDMETCDINNACSSDILKFFSPQELAKTSSVAPGLDNQNIPSGNINNSSISNSSSKCSVPSTTSTYFTPYFLAVEEELLTENDQYNDHEKQLLLEYKSKETENEDTFQCAQTETKACHVKSKREAAVRGASDSYEKALPKHGDILLHKMISTINRNPGQVIR